MKIYRSFEIFNTVRTLSNQMLQPITLLLLSFVFIYCSHIFGCLYFFIGRLEYGKHTRFDGNTWVSSLNNQKILFNSFVVFRFNHTLICRIPSNGRATSFSSVCSFCLSCMLYHGNCHVWRNYSFCYV
jgi:hypothetical protein